MKCNFRHATNNDLPALLKLNDTLRIDCWATEKFQQVFEHDIPVLLAENDLGDILGCVIYLFCLDEIRIIYCVVAEEYRNSRVASGLITKALIDAQNNQSQYALLETRVTNLPAIQLYTSLGFRIINLRKDYYTHLISADAYVMELKL